jgi:drug/metabolite transporter (DMT)-like permease
LTAAAPAPPARAWLGAALVAGGAMLFGTKAVVAKLIYARGLDYESVVVLRSVLALPLFWGWAIHHGAGGAIRRASPRVAGTAAFAGALCYSLGSLLDFYALTLIDAGLERALLFTYPAMVVLAVAVTTRRWPPASILTALGMTWAGVALAVGVFERDLLAANAVGAACVLACAATFAAYFLLSERYIREVGPLAFTAFAMTGAALGLVAWYVPRHVALPTVPDVATWALIAVLVVFCTVAPVLLVAEGVKRIGAERGALVSTVGPPFTILVAWAVLDERLHGVQIAGAALIVAGIVVVERARVAKKTKPVTGDR